METTCTIILMVLTLLHVGLNLLPSSILQNIFLPLMEPFRNRLLKHLTSLDKSRPYNPHSRDLIKKKPHLQVTVLCNVRQLKPAL